LPLDPGATIVPGASSLYKGEFEMKIRIKYLSSLILLTVLSSACGGGSLHVGKLKIGEVRIGMLETRSPNHMAYSYTTFSGHESAPLELVSGQTLTIDYQVRMTKGDLTLEIQDPQNDVLWQKSFQADASETIELQARENGQHFIVIAAESAGGSVDVSWRVE
jgi:hypothetical protein